MKNEPLECAVEFCLIAPTKTVYLDLASKAAPRVRRLCPIGVNLCFEHAKDADVEDFVDGEVWSEICAKFAEMKLLPPTPKLTKLELRDLDETVAP